MKKGPVVTRPNRINHEIRARQVRLIDAEGQQRGVFSFREALLEASDAGLDLVEINPAVDPVVCRLMNYGKYLYERSKVSKEQRKKQKIIQVKELKFRPGTDEGDYQIKLRNVLRFLEEGDKVKITLRFRGRELLHNALGLQVLERIKEDSASLSVVEFFPSRVEGRQMVMILAPKRRV